MLTLSFSKLGWFLWNCSETESESGGGMGMMKKETSSTWRKQMDYHPCEQNSPGKEIWTQDPTSFRGEELLPLH